jgi:hypothetical protein
MNFPSCSILAVFADEAGSASEPTIARRRCPACFLVVVRLTCDRLQTKCATAASCFRAAEDVIPIGVPSSDLLIVGDAERAVVLRQAFS